MDGLDGSLRIAGEPRPGALGGSFETRARSFPWLDARRWSRAEPPDVEAALEAAARALGPWAALPREERLERLLAARQVLEAGPAVEVLAGALGLAEAELAPRHAEGLFRLGEGLEILRDGGGSGVAPAAGAFCAHWSELAAELCLRLAARLVEGHAALVVSDPALPEAAALVVGALERAGLPPGAVALLHDDRRAALRGALSGGALGWLRVRGTHEALEALGSAPAGPGVGTERSFWPLSNATAVVLEGDEPARLARELALKALGRSSTLTGQLPGQVGRVICHQRLFSRFSEEFLHGLEDGSEPELGPPVPAIEGDLPAYVRRAWALGLDEGATPIHGGEPLVRAAAVPGDAPGAADGPEPDPARARGRAPRVVPPVVFTNVEPGRRLARLRRPAPVVCLVRASSDEAARELAAELDRG